MLDGLREMQSRNGQRVAITGGQEFLNTLERGIARSAEASEFRHDGSADGTPANASGI